MISQRQLEIAFGKFASGHRPGEESWSDYDQQALDYVLGGANVKDDNLVNEDELLERIKDLLYPDFCKHYPAIIELTTSRQCDNVASKLLELFKTYQNSVLRPVNNSDE